MKTRWLLPLLSLLLVTSAPQIAHASDDFNLCLSHEPPPGAAVSIPEDDAIHVDAFGKYPHMFEEWYYNGLFFADSKQYGFEALFFQFSFPPEMFGLPPEYPQVILKFIHQSLSDVDADTYENNFIALFDFSGVGFPHVPNGYDLDLADPSTGASLSVEGGEGSDHIVAHYESGAVLNLYIESLKNPLYSFINGLGEYTDDVTGESHGTQFYYNRPWWVGVGSFEKLGQLPNLAVGQAWQDRQFGTVIGTPGTQTENVRWVWYSLRLNNGEQYHMWDMEALDTGNTLIRVVNRQGPPLSCEEEIIFAFDEAPVGEVINPIVPSEPPYGEMFSFAVPSRGLSGIFTSITDTPQIANTPFFGGTLEGAFKFRPAVGQPAIGEGYVEQTHNCCSQ